MKRASNNPSNVNNGDRPSEGTDGRYLAAVMFIDVVGFTALVQDDESQTLRKLEINRKLVKQSHDKFQGRIIQYYGDGTLSVFRSTFDAVSCALEIQKALMSSDCLPSRIGIHLGDIVERNGAIYGDGVNLASRIESVGIPNSILVSGEVYKHLHNHPEFAFKNLGTIRFKNVQFPLEIYALDQKDLAVPSALQLEGKLSTKLRKQPLTGNFLMWIVLLLVASGTIYTYISSQRILSLATGESLATLGVLPFDMSGLGKDDEVLLASLTDEVITNLAAFEGMRVLSPEASAKIKRDKDGPTRKIAESMGVTHLLKGQLKKDADNTFLEVQLVDARTGRNKWKYQFDKPFESLPEIKEDIAKNVAVNLEASENPFLAGVDRKHTSFRVLELYRKARDAASSRSRDGLSLSKELLERSIAVDSTFALGYAGLSQCYSLMKVYELIDTDTALFYASEYAGRAFLLDRDLAEAYVADALRQYTFFLSDSREVFDLCQHAIQLKPSYDYAYHLLGKVLFDAGKYHESLSYFNHAHRLNPYEYVYQKMIAKSMEAAGDKTSAERQYMKLLSNYPDNDDAIASVIKFYANLQDWQQVESLLKKQHNRFDKLCSELYVNTQKGDLSLAGKKLDTLKSQFPEKSISALEACFFDRMGHKQTTLMILQEANEKKQDWLKELRQMHLSDEIQKEPSFQRILESIQIDSDLTM